MSKFTIVSQALTVGSLLIGTAAFAQTTKSPDTPPTMGQVLFDKGIILEGDYTGEAAANPSGGISQGSAYAGQVYVGGKFDFAKISGIPGLSAYIAVVERHGRNLAADYIGNNTSVQEIFGTQDIHLANFTFNQKLFDGRIDITAGRTVANITFLNSDIYCNFQSNSACGNPTFIFKDSNFTYWPASSWGGDVKGWLSNRYYVHVGAYEANPYDQLTNVTHGFDWSTRNATGVVFPYELGYATTFANDPMPRHYQIGGWFDTSQYSNPLYDTKGGNAVLSGLPNATEHGRSGGFVRFDQVIWRPDMTSQRNLTLFGVAMTNFSGQVTENQFYEIGLLQTGTFEGRNKDTLGFVINDQVFSSLALNRTRLARMSVGGNGNIPTNEFMMELAYGAQLTSAIRLSPNLQYIVNPDQMNEPFRTKNIPNAFVVGFKFDVDLANLAGLSPPAAQIKSVDFGEF